VSNIPGICPSLSFDRQPSNQNEILA